MEGHAGCVPAVATVHSVAVNIGVHASLWTSVFIDTEGGFPISPKERVYPWLRAEGLFLLIQFSFDCGSPLTSLHIL